MDCNTRKCKELCIAKKGVPTNTYTPLYGIEQVDKLTILGITLQNDCKFSAHIRSKLCEANKCLYVIRSLRKEGYTQQEIDHLFNAIVLTKLFYCLSVYGASPSDLNTVQGFLTRCYKRRYISSVIDIHCHLEV